jgi:DNA-binding MarR family transcriptional regulator
MIGECKTSNSVGNFGTLLRGAHRTYNARFRALIPPATLTISQFQVLISIRDLEPCSLSTIGRYLKLDPATICGVVFRLEHRGLVSLLKDNEDHRRHILKIELTGLRILARTRPRIKNLEEITTGKLEATEKLKLLKLLKKIGR